MDRDEWASAGPARVLEFWFPGRRALGFDGHPRHVLGAPHARRRRRGDLPTLCRTDGGCGKRPSRPLADTPRGRLALEGKENGHFDALAHPWEKQFHNIAITHCEGPNHLARVDRVLASVESIAAEAPEHLRAFYRLGIEHNETVRKITALYGRHPHRNAILGRISTPQEEVYIAAGEFPHERDLPDEI